MTRTWKPAELILGVLSISLLTLVACIAPIKAPAAETTINTEASTPLVTTDSMVTVIGGDEAALRDFLEHWLTPVFPVGAPSQITVTIGQLPAALPVSLTIPNTVTVVGAIAQSGDYTNVQLLLSSRRIMDAPAVNALRQQLEAQGFTPPEQSMSEPPVGFQSSSPVTTLLCSADDQWFADFLVTPSARPVTDIRLNFNRLPADGSPCQPVVSPADPGYSGIVPLLSAPVNATVRSSGTSYGPDEAGISAEIESSQTITELTAHYATQLTTAGWAQVDSSTTEHLTWSAWQKVDETGATWDATFFMVQRAGEGENYLTTLSLKRQR